MNFRCSIINLFSCLVAVNPAHSIRWEFPQEFRFSLYLIQLFFCQSFRRDKQTWTERPVRVGESADVVFCIYHTGGFLGGVALRPLSLESKKSLNILTF
jgi:hypothetical protein